MNRLRFLVPALALALLASSGCGKKGALYRPDEGPPKKEQAQPSSSQPPTSDTSPAK